MKTLKSLMIITVWVCVTVSLVFPAWGLGPQPEPPDKPSIILQKGTKVEKIGAGHFKFKLPDGRIVEVKNLVRSTEGATYVIGDCGIFDPRGKLIVLGKQGSLKSMVKPSGQSKAGMIGDTGSYVKIDDDPTYLPAILSFQTKGIVDPQPPGSKR